MRQIESFYGKYEDFDVVADRIITDRVRLVYYVMNYEDAPVFGVISYYRKGDEEIAANFNFHTEIWSIFPADVIFHGVNW